MPNYTRRLAAMSLASMLAFLGWCVPAEAVRYNTSTPPARSNLAWSGVFASTPQGGIIPHGSVVSAMDDLGQIYVAGTFDLPGVGPIRVAWWDGSHWEIIGNRVVKSGAIESHVSAIAVDGAGNIYVGGLFTDAYHDDGSFVSSRNIVRWNAVALQWESIGEGTDGWVRDIAALPNGDLYVAGDFSVVFNPGGGAVSAPHIARWDSGL